MYQHQSHSWQLAMHVPCIGIPYCSALLDVPLLTGICSYYVLLTQALAQPCWTYPCSSLLDILHRPLLSPGPCSATLLLSPAGYTICSAGPAESCRPLLSHAGHRPLLSPAGHILLLSPVGYTIAQPALLNTGPCPAMLDTGP